MTTRITQVYNPYDWDKDNGPVDPTRGGVFNFDVTNFPGNKNVAVVHSLEKLYGAPKIGAGAFDARMMMLKKMGYSYVLFTTLATNKRQLEIVSAQRLLKVTKLSTFYTGRMKDVEVHLYGVDLYYDP